MKSPNDFSNEISRAVSDARNESLELHWDIIRIVAGMCFDQAAEMQEAGINAEEIRRFGKRVR